MDCYQVVNKNFTTWNKQFSYKLISLCNEPEIFTQTVGNANYRNGIAQ